MTDLTLTRARRTPLLLALTLALAACATTPTPQSAGQTQAQDYVYDGSDTGWADTAASPAITAQSIGTGDNNLSNENWTSATSGYGPIEKDKSNNTRAGGDGHTLTIGGQTYAKGFGVHANSTMTFNINGQCSTFTASVGVDDEVGSKGSVVFQVFADGTKLYDSGTVRGSDGAKAINVSVAGKKELKLVVTDAGDGLDYDHADWASPVLKSCTAAAAAPITYTKGQLVITKGGTYSGNWENTSGSAILIQTSDPVVIENSNIRATGNLISGFRNRLTVRNVHGYLLNPNVAGKTAGRAVNAEENISLDVENSYFEGSSGIYVRAYFGDASKGDTVKILRNQFRNIDGRQSNGAGGYNGNYTIVQAVLFNTVQHIPGAEIAWNEIINEPNKSRTEETFNMLASSGTPSKPILIHDNYIQGAYPLNPATTTSYAGGGILLGDGKVTNPLDAGYARVYNNQIVGTTNHGIAIAGGVDNQMYNNRVISSGRLPDGTPIPSENVGMYVWDPMGAGKLTPPTFANNVMRDNVIGWTKVASNGQTTDNPMWTPNCGLNGTVCSNNQNLGTITQAMEQAEYARWQSKTVSASVQVGPAN